MYLGLTKKHRGVCRAAGGTQPPKSEGGWSELYASRVIMPMRLCWWVRWTGGWRAARDYGLYCLCAKGALSNTWKHSGSAPRPLGFAACYRRDARRGRQPRRAEDWLNFEKKLNKKLASFKNISYLCMRIIVYTLWFWQNFHIENLPVGNWKSLHFITRTLLLVWIL